MLSHLKRKYLLSIIFALALCFKGNVSFAAYDVIKATTMTEYNPAAIINEEEDEVVVEVDEYNPLESQGDLAQIIEEKLKKVFKKKNKNELDEQTDSTEDIKEEEIKEDGAQKAIAATVLKNSSDESALVVDDKNKFQINADKIAYNDEEGNVYATGNVEIIALSQGVKLKADNAVLDKENQILKLSDNVKIIKQGSEMRGESLTVDLNEQNILMDNPELEAYSFLIKAQEGYLIANDIQMLSGNVKSTQKKDFPLVTRGFMRLDATYKNPFFDKTLFQDDDNQTPTKAHAYRIDSKEVVITSYKDHNSVVLKGSNVYFNNHKVIRNSDIEIISDKQRQIVESNMPEAGNLRNFGTYIGYGLVYKLPQGHTLKLMPVLAYSDSDVGIGAIARYRSKNGIVDGGWNTASSNLVVRGRYNITNGLGLTYGRNAYMPEGFMGARRSGYAAQLQYTKSYRIKDLDAGFSNGVYAGIFSDYQKHDQEDAYCTTRFRYMAQLNKNILRYKNKEQGHIVSLDAVSQGAATVYGSGETHGIIRVGPQLTTRVKRWESSIAYFLTGEHGDSPFIFDKYRYGKSTINLNERFYFNDKVALGFRMYISPMKDNYEEDLLTECRFYLIVGPKDAKLALSYDFVRDVAHMDVMFLLGSQNSTINFDKLSTKDIDGKVEKRDFYKNAKPVRIENPEDI